MNELPKTVWTLLHSTIDEDKIRLEDFQHDCLLAVYICMNVVYTRVFQLARKLPWRLVRGDISANLTSLLAGDLPEDADAVTRKIFRLAGARGRHDKLCELDAQQLRLKPVTPSV